MSLGQHSAAASAAGYLYQIQWALLNLLREAPTRPDQAISLEMHDDVSWSAGGSATELLQTKLHASATAGLGDKDSDIWKTLLVWMDREDVKDPQGPDLVLVTTSVAAEGSAAHALRPGPTRNPELALARLTEAARASDAKSTKKGRERFLGLSPAERSALLGRVRVMDGEVGLGDLHDGVRQALMFALPQNPQQQDLFLAAVWTWWAGVSVDMLQGRRAAVDVSLVKAFVADLRDKFGHGDLPTTVHVGDVTQEHVDLYAKRRFVQQLDLVRYPPANLRRAVVDYHRAVAQETQWLDDNLVGLHELRRFEDNLRDEWSRAFTDMLDDLAGGSGEYCADEVEEATKVRAGKQLLRQLLDSTSVCIRKQYADPFFARGKRHELADRSGGIGWHPDFAGLLEAVVATA
jgi:hypothetical protein